METTAEKSSHPEINGPDSPTYQIDGSDSQTAPEVCNRDHVLAELEENLLFLQREKDEAVNCNNNPMKMMDELSRERDALHDKMGELEAVSREREEGFAQKIDEKLKEKEEIKREIEVSLERIGVLELEKKGSNEFLLKSLDSIRLVKENLVKIIECLDDEKVMERENSAIVELNLDQESTAISEEIIALTMLASKAQAKVSEYKEGKRKEMKALVNSVVSLTEENRDMNRLLKIALVEKEAVEKSLNRLKGNSEQRRVGLLQIAERGLHRVGFGFMMGSGNNEQPPEGSGASLTTASNKSDSSECEVEVVSLASTVERIMKNLRLEISQLRNIWKNLSICSVDGLSNKFCDKFTEIGYK